MEAEKKLLFRVTDLKQYFPLKKQLGKPQLYVKANDGLTFDIYEGETFGLVGESGCGKSTLGRVLLQLYHQSAGKSMYYGRTINDMAPVYVKKLLKNIDKRRKHARELEAAAKKLEAEYNTLSETEQMDKHNALVESQKAAEIAWLDIVQILGGFVVLPDITPAANAMLEEWEIARKLRKVREDENEWLQKALAAETHVENFKKAGQVSNRANKRAQKARARQDQLLKTIGNLESQLQAAAGEVENLRTQHAELEDFAEQEARRDQGIDLAKLKYKEVRLLRKEIQLIFQDPYSSLNPRMTVGQIIGEGLKSHKFFAKNDPRMQDYILKVMEDCGLAPYFIHRYPHQFSGGQRQRIGIARSLAVQPKFVVCDEAVSALDVSIQSQVINLLRDMKEKENYTYLFITHDLSVVKYISDRIAVMYLGNIVELTSSKDLFDRPMHPYTEALLSSIPTTDVDSDKEPIILAGDIPSPINPPSGCKFHTRCRYCTDICTKVVPELELARPGHLVACHHKLNDGE